MSTRCDDCGEPADEYFYMNSGGLCQRCSAEAHEEIDRANEEQDADEDEDEEEED